MRVLQILIYNVLLTYTFVLEYTKEKNFTLLCKFFFFANQHFTTHVFTYIFTRHFVLPFLVSSSRLMIQFSQVFQLKFTQIHLLELERLLTAC